MSPNERGRDALGIFDGTDCGTENNSVGNNHGGLIRLGQCRDGSLISRAVSNSRSAADDGVDLSSKDGECSLGLTAVFSSELEVSRHIAGGASSNQSSTEAKERSGRLHVRLI